MALLGFMKIIISRANSTEYPDSLAIRPYCPSILTDPLDCIQNVFGDDARKSLLVG